MKLLAKDPAFLTFAQKGQMEELNDWLHEQLDTQPPTIEHQRRTGDLMQLLASQKSDAIDETKKLEPLDLYRSSTTPIDLQGTDTKKIRTALMTSLAYADADIAWAKGHPGQTPPENMQYNED